MSWESSTSGMSTSSRPNHNRSQPEVSITQTKIRAMDGFQLAATLYLPADSPTAGVIVICGATGVKRSFYHRYARFLADSGFRVVTLAARGP